MYIVVLVFFYKENKKIHISITLSFNSISETNSFFFSICTHRWPKGRLMAWIHASKFKSLIVSLPCSWTLWLAGDGSECRVWVLYSASAPSYYILPCCAPWINICFGASKLALLCWLQPLSLRKPGLSLTRPVRLELFDIISRHNSRNQNMLHLQNWDHFKVNWELSRDFPEYERRKKSGAGFRLAFPSFS